MNNAAASSRLSYANGDEFVGASTFVPHAKEGRTTLPHGAGMLERQNGDSFEGIFKNNSFEMGVFQYHRQKQFYAGGFLCELPHGHGALTFANGDVYEGRFHMGAITGKGRYLFTNGNVLLGEFKDGVCLRGVKHFPKEQFIYTGCFDSNGNFAGPGKLQCEPLTLLYVGDFKNGKFNGSGVFKLNNLKITCKNWVDNQLSGETTVYFLDTNIKYVAFFHKNVPVGKVQIWINDQNQLEMHSEVDSVVLMMRQVNHVMERCFLPCTTMAANERAASWAQKKMETIEVILSNNVLTDQKSKFAANENSILLKEFGLNMCSEYVLEKISIFEFQANRASLPENIQTFLSEMLFVLVTLSHNRDDENETTQNEPLDLRLLNSKELIAEFVCSEKLFENLLLIVDASGLLGVEDNNKDYATCINSARRKTRCKLLVLLNFNSKDDNRHSSSQEFMKLCVLSTLNELI